MQYRVPLRDGTAAAVAPGDLLPHDLHPDFEYVALPGESIAAAKGSNVLVRTTVAQRDLNVQNSRKSAPDERRHVLACAGRSIRNAMPVHARVYARMEKGERRGKRQWQNLIDDFSIVLSDQLARGETLWVLLDAPVISPDGMSATAPKFRMKLHDSDAVTGGSSARRPRAWRSG